MQQPAPSRRRSNRTNGARITAQKILQQLFVIEPGPVDDSRALADYQGSRLLHVAEPLNVVQWQIQVKERVYACFGVSCDLHEPLWALVARVELAQRGVGCTFTH